MSTYTFLISNQDKSEGIEKFYAISSDKIEKLAYSDTYDQFGQKVGVDDAGDWLTLKTELAIDYVDYLFNTRYKIGDTITAYDEYTIYTSLLTKFGENSKDIDVEKSWIKGFNYWDVHNWKTIVVEYEYDGFPTHEIIDDEDLIKKLNQVIDDMNFVEHKFGYKLYQKEEFNVIESFCQGSWATYEISFRED